MKTSKAGNVSRKGTIEYNREYRAKRTIEFITDYQLYPNKQRQNRYDCGKDVGCQCNQKSEMMYSSPMRAEVVYYSGVPKQVFTYSRPRSFTNVGVGSACMQKKRVRKIYLPETEHRGVGSSELSSLKVDGKSRHERDIRPYARKRTSTKCVGGAAAIVNKCSEKLSPMNIHNSIGTSPNVFKDIKTFSKDIGNNTFEKNLANTTTQADNTDQQQVSSKQMKISKTAKDIEPIDTVRSAKYSTKKYQATATINKSSDSLEQHVHNLEDPSFVQSTGSSDPMENKLEKEYRKIFSSKNKEDSKIIIEKPIEDLNVRTSLLRRRFEALKRGIAKKEEPKKNHTLPSKESDPPVVQNSVTPIQRDISIESDPPSLEARSYSHTKIFSPAPSVHKHDRRSSHPRKNHHTGKKEKLLLSPSPKDKLDEADVKAMFKIWGDKFNFEEEKKAAPVGVTFDTKPKEIKTKLNEPKTESEYKKEGKRFFFFKKKSKGKDKEKDKVKDKSSCDKKGVTTGRCEVKNCTVLNRHNEPEEKSKIVSIKSEEDILKKNWLKNFIQRTIESRKSLQIRWNNKTYTTSSSTVFELMDNMYRQANAVIRTQSEASTISSYYPSYHKHRVNFVQDVEAWMIPKMIAHSNVPYVFRRNDDINRMSDRKWFIDKSKAFAHEIELVLNSKNVVRCHRTISSDYLRIDIPKGFFTDPSSDSDKFESNSEEVYKIIEYESPESRSGLRFNVGNNIGDFSHNDVRIKKKVSVRDKNADTRVIETVIKKPPAHRDVVIQVSNVHIPKRCDVIGVGIITHPVNREVEKSLLNTDDEVSEVESEQLRENKLKQCQFAESYLRDYYRHWMPLGIDLFPERVSDFQLKCESQETLSSLHNQGDCSKSCPNIPYDYQSDINWNPSTNSHGSYKEAIDKTKVFNTFKSTTQPEPSPDFAKRVLPKDSFEVLRKRLLYACGNRSKWNYPDDQPYSVPSIEDKAEQDALNDTCKMPDMKQCRKRVSMTKCDFPPECSVKIESKPAGILSYNKKSLTSLYTKRAVVSEEDNCIISSPPCDEFCMNTPKPKCSQKSSTKTKKQSSKKKLPDDNILNSLSPIKTIPCNLPCKKNSPCRQNLQKSVNEYQCPCICSSLKLISSNQSNLMKKRAKVCTCPPKKPQSPTLSRQLTPRSDNSNTCPRKKMTPSSYSPSSPRPESPKEMTPSSYSPSSSRQESPSPCCPSSPQLKSQSPRGPSSPKPKPPSPCEQSSLQPNIPLPYGPLPPKPKLPSSCSHCGMCKETDGRSSVKAKLPSPCEPSSPKAMPTSPCKPSSPKLKPPSSYEPSSPRPKPPSACEPSSPKLKPPSPCEPSSPKAMLTSPSKQPSPKPKPQSPCEPSSPKAMPTSPCKQPSPKPKLPSSCEPSSPQPKPQSPYEPSSPKAMPTSPCKPQSPKPKPPSSCEPSCPNLKPPSSNEPSSPRPKSQSPCGQSSPKLKTPSSFGQSCPKLKPPSSCGQSCPKLKPPSLCGQSCPKAKPPSSSTQSSPTPASACTSCTCIGCLKKLLPKCSNESILNKSPISTQTTPNLKNPATTASMPCPNSPTCKNVKSQSKIQGVHLKVVPAPTCDTNCRAKEIRKTISDEQIMIRVKESTPSTEELKDGVNFKVQDADGKTLYERRDYKVDRGIVSHKSSLLGDVYKVSRVSTASVDKLSFNSDKRAKSISNIIEISFGLKVTQGDKIAEISLSGNNDEADKAETNCYDGKSQDVFMINSETTHDDTNDKNDINIKIVIKNFDTKTAKLSKKSKPEKFAKKISQKFHTVSTGYSDILGSHIDDMYSMHKTTIDLTDSKSQPLLNSRRDEGKEEINEIITPQLQTTKEILPKEAEIIGDVKMIDVKEASQKDDQSIQNTETYEVINKSRHNIIESKNSTNILLNNVCSSLQKSTSSKENKKEYLTSSGNVGSVDKIMICKNVSESKLVEEKTDNTDDNSNEIKNDSAIKQIKNSVTITSGILIPELQKSDMASRKESKSETVEQLYNNETCAMIQKSEIYLSSHTSRVANITEDKSLVRKSECNIALHNNNSSIPVIKSLPTNTDDMLECDAVETKSEIGNISQDSKNHIRNGSNITNKQIESSDINPDNLVSDMLQSILQQDKIFEYAREEVILDSDIDNDVLMSGTTQNNETYLNLDEKMNNFQGLEQQKSGCKETDGTKKLKFFQSLQKKFSPKETKAQITINKFSNDKQPRSTESERIISDLESENEQTDLNQSHKSLRFTDTDDQNNSQELTNTSDDSTIFTKPLTKREKKEMLKSVFEKATNKKWNSKSHMKRLKNMLKFILASDSSDVDDLAITSKDLMNDDSNERKNSAYDRPTVIKNTDSMNNYYRMENILTSEENIKTPDEGQYPSECSDSSDYQLNINKCLCRTMAERLRKDGEILKGGCCCKPAPVITIHEQTSCNMNKDNIYMVNYKAAEYIDVQTQNSLINSRMANFQVEKVMTSMKCSPFENIRENQAVFPFTDDKESAVNNVKTNTVLGLLEDSKIVIRTSDSKQASLKTEIIIGWNGKDKKKQKVSRKTSFSTPADILQSYETKKAVLEIYTEKTMTKEGERLVAKLPKFENNYLKNILLSHDSL